MGDQDLEIIKNVHNNRRGGGSRGGGGGMYMRDYVGAYLARGNDRICAMIAASSIISVLIKRGYVGVEVRTGRPTFRVLSTFTAASSLLVDAAF